MPEIAYQHIRQAILSGALAPGIVLDQDTLARALQMSRMPVREALQRLAQDGWVTITPHRSATVATVTAETVHDLYLVWTLLEGFAVELSVAQHTGEALPRLRELHAQLTHDSQRNDTVAWVQHNREFHMLIHQAAGSLRLAQLLEDYWDSSSRFLSLYSEVADERFAESLHEHEEILHAYATHDAARAAVLTKQHLAMTQEQLIAHLRRRAQHAEPG
jgi:DNA-binding GntR family transcriptional regulator